VENVNIFQMPEKNDYNRTPSKCGTFSFPFPNHVSFVPLKFIYLQKKLQKRGNGDELDTIISFHSSQKHLLDVRVMHPHLKINGITKYPYND
jgi:hypothetical protein